MSRLREMLTVPHQSGFIKVFSFDKLGNVVQLVEKPNLIVYSGADVVAQLLAWQQSYIPRVVYIEYENTTGTPTPPSITRADDDLSYYTGLTTPQDYIRVPIGMNPALSTSDAVKYVSNVVTYYALSGATAGEHSVPFSAAANSKVYGVALVAAPDLADPTRDVILSRSYFGTAVAKGDAQIGIQWEIICK